MRFAELFDKIKEEYKEYEELADDPEYPKDELIEKFQEFMGFVKGIKIISETMRYSGNKTETKYFNKIDRFIMYSKVRSKFWKKLY